MAVSCRVREGRGKTKEKRYPLLLGEFGQAPEQYPDWDEEDDEDDE